MTIIKLNKLFEKNNDNIFFNKFEEYLLKSLSFAILLFPLSLLSGPFIPDLIISLSSLFFLYISSKHKLNVYYNNFLIKILLIFWLYLVFSSLFSDNIFFSLKSSFFYFRFILFSIFIFFLLERYNNFIVYFFYSLILAYLIVVIDSLIQFYFGVSFTGNLKPNLRLTGPFGDRQIVGSYLSRLFPLLLFIFFILKKKINFNLFVFFALISLTILFSGERTALFMFNLIFFLMLFIYFKSKKKFFIVFLIYVLSILILVFSNKDLKQRIFVNTLQSFGLVKFVDTDGMNKYFEAKSEKNFYIISQAHEWHYQTALKMFFDNPLIGVGPNMFRKKCSDDKYYIAVPSCTTHPHNFLIQILAETGIIGAIFYLFLFFLNLFQILKAIFLNKIKNVYSNYLYCSFFLNIGFFINIFVFILPNGNFFNNYLNSVIYLPLGFYLYLNKYKNV